MQGIPEIRKQKGGSLLRAEKKGKYVKKR